MAQSVPREVLDRARRNAPPDQQQPPRFGTFAWRAQSVAGSSSVTATEPVPTVRDYSFHIVYNDPSQPLSPTSVIHQRFYRAIIRGPQPEFDVFYSENEQYQYSWQGRTVWGMSILSGGNFGAWSFDGAVIPNQIILDVGAAGTSTSRGATTVGNIYLTAFNYMISAYSTNSQINGKLFYNAGRTLNNAKSIYYSQDKEFILSANGSTQWFMFPISDQSSSYSWNAAGAFPTGSSLGATGSWAGTSTTLQWLCG
jgi:hypothetical protein